MAILKKSVLWYFVKLALLSNLFVNFQLISPVLWSLNMKIFCIIIVYMVMTCNSAVCHTTVSVVSVRARSPLKSDTGHRQRDVQHRLLRHAPGPLRQVQDRLRADWPGGDRDLQPGRGQGAADRLLWETDPCVDGRLVAVFVEEQHGNTRIRKFHFTWNQEGKSVN